jgi:sigma-B regulation protein RsbU (phosphoserine phosphatase)
VQPKVLFVDDDPKILAAFRRQLRKKLDITTVTSGGEGLHAVRSGGPFSVVVTDFCMPVMNGIEFLKQVRHMAPESVRMLLTGSADLNAAIQAVNQGHIFRFLTKPCSPEALLDALSAGVREYRSARRERRFNKRTRRWLSQANDIQQSLMPIASLGLAGMDIAGRSIYCEQTGGDYYDYFEKHVGEDPRIDMVVGDVSEHGLPSALLMTSARAFLRECAARIDSVAGIVGSVNRQLTRDLRASTHFMTLFFAEICPSSGNISWVRAGHDPALLFDPDTGGFEELNGQGGLPLGVLADAVYEEYHRKLRPGQIVAIGTDGIWEARNSEGHMFGKLRLQQTIRENADRAAAEIVQAVLAALKQFLCPLELQDDATLVVLKVEN